MVGGIMHLHSGTMHLELVGIRDFFFFPMLVKEI